MRHPEPGRRVRPGSSEAIEWAVYLGGAAAALGLTNVLDLPTILVGLPPLFFIAYVMRKSHRARRARRAEEAGEISNALHSADRCDAALDLLEEIVGRPGDTRERLALDRLSDGVGVFVSRYRRYLDDEAIRSALEAEGTVLRAELGAEHGELPRIDSAWIDSMRFHIAEIREGVLDVDHPNIRDMRDRV
ncbi:MAG: hypothetical protein OXU86_08130 [Thaumarchaeota archaeon]|nr:hypothetical protein [Nitrososphaerota archaeon]